MNVWLRLVRFGFRLLYHELAFTYDAVSRFVSLGAWRSWQRSALSHLPAPSAGLVLELAHGTGDLQLDLHERGYRSIGCDFSPQMGRIAWRKLARHLQPRLLRCQAQHLPFPDHAFSAIVVTFPTDFIIHPQTLSEAFRVLSSEGLLVVVLNGDLKANDPLSHLIEWLYRITGQRQARVPDWPTLLATFGFEAQLINHDLGRTQSQVLVAHKKTKSG
jgi:ubiquinone/menaquinone biosynthesis C-methylase UbiE